MSGRADVRVMLLKCLLLLSLSGCLGQKDCTGVDCPVLENCIEESLGGGACCATCVKTGCTCQGYQYYDCVNAGFREGKVPEAESYFVDFGSTECSCPEGGGRISCHFIPCPDIPANCIELSEPSDGCIQCERVGCVHNEQKYEAGHSFHMDPCQVCHCPNDGGSLMCYPVPDCDPSKVEKPVLATTTEENVHKRPQGNPLQFIFQHQGPRDSLSKPFRLAHGDTLPLFTQHPNNLDDDEEADYDYMPTDTPGPPLVDLAAPTESSIISVSYPESFTPRVGLHRDMKQELRETFAVHHEATSQIETTHAPTTLQETTLQHHREVTTASWYQALENQVFPLEIAGAADHDDRDAGGSDEDEDEEREHEEEVEEEEERTLTSHAFTVFPQRGNHGSPNHRLSETQSRPVMHNLDSSADHLQGKTTHTRPVVAENDRHKDSLADHAHNRNTQSRPIIEEVSQDRGTFTDHGHDRNTQSRPVMENVDKDRGTLSDHGHDRNTQSRPIMEQLDPQMSTFSEHGGSKTTQSRPVIQELDRERGTFTEHGHDRNTQSRPVIEEVDRERGTFPQGHSLTTQTRPVMAEIDRDKGSFADHGHDRTTQSRPVIEDVSRDRGTFSDHGHDRNTQSRPVIEHLDPQRGTFSGHGGSKTTQSRPVMEEVDRERGTFPQQGHSQTTQTRPVMAEMDRDKGSFADHGHNRNTQSRPVMEEVVKDRGTFTDHGDDRNTQSRPVMEEVDQDRGSYEGHENNKKTLSRPVQDEVDRDKGIGHRPWRPSPEEPSARLDRPQEHVTPPPVVVNFAEHTTRPQRVHEIHTFPAVRFFTTSQPPLRVKADGGHPARNQTQELGSVHAEERERERERQREDEEERGNSLSSLPLDNRGAFAMRQVERCCEVGRKWASENHHCNHMAAMPDDSNILCSVAQDQCCTGALRQSRCLAGMSAARGGDACQAPPDGRHCGEDSYQECCSCCSLGLQLREAGLGCQAHQHLDYPCGHILLTCCEEEEEGAGGYGPEGPTLRRKEMPKPATTPQKVSDRKFPKEAFSAGDNEDAGANSLEETGDVDACQKYAARLCHHICINTWGSYQCGCHPGHVLLQDGHTCAPEDSEEDNRLREEEERPVMQTTSRLTTSTSSSSSSLTTTTTTTTQIPVLLNPCAGNGPCAQRCSVAGGRAKCSCFPGFSLMADGHSCEDVDECLTNTHTCKPSERCVNTVGAFVCERQITCSPGYQLRNGVCEDIDECVVRTHNCGSTTECKNTDGSFSCVPKQRCYTGFTQDTHSNCIDIDECSTLGEPCSAGFNCINTVGSYTCQRKVIMCSPGYHASPDGARCIDVDECQTGIHRCGEGQICQNVPGSYRCNCQTGYQFDAIRQSCVDVNECWHYPGRLCAQTCDNTPGSYQCSCTAGFSLAFDGKNCEDVNECDTNACSQECANIYGSYQCYCKQGFYLKEDGHTCEDIDECSQSIGHLCAFQCVNIPGSYQCACPPSGYSMSPNGRTCRDVDECAIGSHNCSLSESCFNIQGGFRCLSFSCPSNYRKVSDTRCERVSCLNVQDCQSSPLRITYYQLSFQTNIVIPAQIFRIGPSPAYAGDSIMIGITRGNEEGFFSTRRLNGFTGAVYLQRQVREPRDFLIDVEMKLLRQGTYTTFLARIYVFITANAA
ncbi:fibulin-2 isoform X2 [Clupea harengus]|uniref:Fibulin-2 isoform X2 n=1 Tax=Clupea harengus TaxID=7950 RepID=A0A6P8FIM2_CLUHA|nr:fibulin-2 isoform X2 [Clupea harengus]